MFIIIILRLLETLPRVHKAYEASEFMEVINDVELSEMLVSTEQR